MNKRTRSLWLISGFSSLLLLGLVLAQVDWQAAARLIESIRMPWALAALLLLMAEGVITAIRFRLLALRTVALADCLNAAGWYVIGLIALPARLGEIAGIAVIARLMNQGAGAATASLLYQRILDLVVLLAAAAGVTTVFAAGEQAQLIVAGSVALAFTLLMSLVFVDRILGSMAVVLLRRPRGSIGRKVLRVVLQARTYSRHHMTLRRSVLLVVWTVAKWGVNLGAVVCLVFAVSPAFTLIPAAAIGIVYNFSAVIPIQTVGGFGISEAALLGTFSWFGHELGEGAALAIAIRLGLLSGPILFWLVVTTLYRAVAQSRNLSANLSR